MTIVKQIKFTSMEKKFWGETDHETKYQICERSDYLLRYLAQYYYGSDKFKDLLNMYKTESIRLSKGKKDSDGNEKKSTVVEVSTELCQYIRMMYPTIVGG